MRGRVFTMFLESEGIDVEIKHEAGRVKIVFIDKIQDKTLTVWAPPEWASKFAAAVIHAIYFET